MKTEDRRQKYEQKLRYLKEKLEKKLFSQHIKSVYRLLKIVQPDEETQLRWTENVVRIGENVPRAILNLAENNQETH